MGKSSSSLKKIKHSTDSSSKLRSVKKKNKTKRNNKSKKIRRIKDYSDESGSESNGSDSSLYSTSEDDYKRRKKRRSKLIKKRSRKRYSSSESDDDDDDDDDDVVVKKKKRSKRKDEHIGKKNKKKKIVSRKRRKRDSSSSNGSESDGKRRFRERGRLGKVNDVEPDESWQGEDEVMTEKKNPRRLKSIVVVSYTYDNDDQRKEEDDHDDRELVYSEESYSPTRDDDNGSKTVAFDEFGESSKASSHQDNRMKDDDLEAILKQRALENLKRFRGVARKEVSSVSEPLETESERVEESQDHSLVEQKLCDSAGRKDLETSQVVVNVKESGTVLADVASQQDQQSGETTKVKASSSSGISSCTTKRKLIRPVLRQESLNLASRKEDAEAESINGSASDKTCLESTLAKNGGENKEITKVNSTLNAESSSDADIEALDVVKGGSQSEQKTTDEETKDESHYEKKTMTVMKGGEMVQVSYKVYIPKKASSLGRRQLLKR